MNFQYISEVKPYFKEGFVGMIYAEIHFLIWYDILKGYVSWLDLNSFVIILSIFD